MKTLPSIQIHIPAPCTQQWNEMAPALQGRFCAHCQKDVIDFTGYSDNAIYNFFKKHSKDSVCGRFSSTQLNRAIQIPYQPQSKLYRMAVAFGLILLFIPNPNIQAQTVRQPFVIQNAFDVINKIINEDRLTIPVTGIKGKVTDSTQAPVSQAVVIAAIDRIVKYGVVTDSNGNYTIDSVKPGIYDISVNAINCKIAVTAGVEIKASQLKTIDFNLVPDHSVTMGVIIPSKSKKLFYKSKRSRKTS